jgi:DNA polymerase III delta prime subunit
MAGSAHRRPSSGRQEGRLVVAQRLDPLARSAALERLGALAVAGKLPQSILLIGPQGSGKEAAAIEIARRTLCEKAKDGSTCASAGPRCSACAKVGQLAHPDLLYAFPAEASLTAGGIRALLDEKAREPLARFRQPSHSILAIGDPDDPSPVSIRAARRFVAVKPFEGSRRVVILSDAHRMNRAAANALLKTLEEPPPSAVLLLCTHQPHLLPATVRSRCARILVPALSEGDLASHLEAAHGVDPTEAARVAAVSGGNARSAFDLLDPGAREVADWATALLAMLVEGEGPALLRAAELVAKGHDPRGGKSAARRTGDASLSASRDVAMRVLDFLVADLLSLAKLGAGAAIHPQQATRLARWREALPPAAATAIARELMDARRDLTRNVNVALVLTDVFGRSLHERSRVGASGDR